MLIARNAFVARLVGNNLHNQRVCNSVCFKGGQEGEKAGRNIDLVIWLAGWVVHIYRVLYKVFKVKKGGGSR